VICGRKVITDVLYSGVDYFCYEDHSDAQNDNQPFAFIDAKIPTAYYYNDSSDKMYPGIGFLPDQVKQSFPSILETFNPSAKGKFSMICRHPMLCKKGNYTIPK